MQTYVVELEGYRIGRRFYIKEICLLDMDNGSVFNHCFVKIPAKPRSADKVCQRYVYRHIHGIPFHTRLDKQLPRIPARSLLITHGLEKSRLLQRLYPHCFAISCLHYKAYKRFSLPPDLDCPLIDHGPGCAFNKAHKLRTLLHRAF